MKIVSRKRQAGVTLIEAIASLSVASMVIYGMGSLAMDYMSNTEAITAAQQLKTLGEAGRAYVVDNSGVVAARATTTSSCLIPASELTAYAPGLTGTNAFGQNMAVLVAKNAAGILKTMAVSYGGSYTPNDGQLSMVSNALGGDGGSVFSFEPAQITGSNSSWSLDLTVGLGAAFKSAGVSCATGAPVGAVNIAIGSNAVAYWVADSSVGSQLLYRNQVPGRPDLNTMNTPILMGSVQANNGACTSTGAIARDNNGAVLSCQGGFWKTQGSAFWKDPVANFAALPAGDPLGAVRMTTDTGRAFMWTGGAWAALAVDQNGNMTIPGTVTMAGGRVIAWNQASEGGTITLQGANGVNVYLESNNGTFRLLNSPWNAELFRIDQNGNLVMDERGNGYGTVTPGWAVETWGCSPNGAIGRAAYDTTNGWAYSGITLSCQSGVWARMGGNGYSAGQMCGMTAYGDGGGGVWPNGVPCQGYTPWYGCPPGFTRYSVSYRLFSGSTGFAYGATCVKN